MSAASIAGSPPGVRRRISTGMGRAFGGYFGFADGLGHEIVDGHAGQERSGGWVDGLCNSRGGLDRTIFTGED
jgi:hypothetical protein